MEFSAFIPIKECPSFDVAVYVWVDWDILYRLNSPVVCSSLNTDSFLVYD